MEIDYPAVIGFLLAWYGETLFFGFVLFTPMEWLFGRKDRKGVRSQRFIDYIHLLLDNMIASVGVLMSVAIVGALLQLLITETVTSGFPQLAQGLEWTHVKVEGLSYWQQCLLLIVLSEVCFYFTHRALHQVTWMWRFHAIHHSAEQLDWLATYRAHPIDLVLTRLPLLVLISIIGLHPDMTMWLTVLLTELGTFAHCNVRFRFGPLNYILVTPEFHHWHHSAEREAFDKNFASKFSFLDYIFGTAYFPKDRQANSYGINDPVPASYLKQLSYPFLPKPKQSVVLFDREARLLDELAGNINSHSQTSVERAALLGTLIDAVEESVVDLSAATSEEDLKAIMVAKLNRATAASGSVVA